MIAANLTARELQRVSKDASGRERSDDEQHGDNAAACAEEGIALLGQPYRDVARASRTATAKRHGYERLIADLTADTFAEDVLVMWESSRGSRRVSDWVLLLELLEERGKRVYVTTHRRLYDPSNPRDRRSLLEDAVDSEYESGKSGLRIGRTMAANAKAGGRHGGRRAFGYEAVGAGLVDAEADVIRECVRRVLAGESTRSIAADLNARGITTSAGNAWHPGRVATMLRGPRIAGMRVHKGRVVNENAEWPAIISRDEHRRVVAALANRSPVGRRGRTPWLLTGLLRCGRCHTPLVGNTDSAARADANGGQGARRYVCRKGPGYAGCGSLGIKAEPLEDLLGELATEALADVEARRAATVAADDTGEHAELDRLAAMRIEIADDYAAGLLGREQRLEDLAALERRKAEIETRLAAKTRATAPLDFVRTEGFRGRRWEDYDVVEGRILLDALIDHVTVAPASTRGSTLFEAARVNAPGRIAWKV